MIASTPSPGSRPPAPARSFEDRRLGRLTSPDVADRSAPVLVVPLGSCEQHGPHLPLDTDTRIAVALADILVGRWQTPAVVTPALAIGASGEHAGFPGTLSIGTDALAAVIVELVRSADWAPGVVLVNGHGGNAEAVHRAVRQSRSDGRRVLAWWPSIAGGDAHAGDTETSIMLAIDPHAVRMERSEPGRTEPVIELLDELRSSGVRSVSANGVLGDPTTATAARGHDVIELLSEDLLRCVERWWSS
jgi:mycofactocin precursor peptide peptidase